MKKIRDIESLFDEAYQIREIQRDLLERKQVNRAALRSLKDANKLTKEQASELEELYPVIRRPRQRRIPTL